MSGYDYSQTLPTVYSEQTKHLYTCRLYRLCIYQDDVYAAYMHTKEVRLRVRLLEMEENSLPQQKGKKKKKTESVETRLWYSLDLDAHESCIIITLCFAESQNKEYFKFFTTKDKNTSRVPINI